MDSNDKSGPPTDGTLNDVEDTFSFPSTSSIGSLPPEDQKEESSSDGVIDCDDWHDLGQSDYAKVIFCDLYYEPFSGNVGCNFEITDCVHEDPCDHIGLFHIGFESLSECLASKSLSETTCEDDGKRLSCDFKYEELPELDMGFYQFLYITHDQEICGASMPFEIKPRRTSLSPDSVVAEKVDDDFLLVSRGLEKKNEELVKQLVHWRQKNQELVMAMAEAAKDRKACDSEKMAMLESFQNTIENLTLKLAKEAAEAVGLKENMDAVAAENKIMKEQLQNKSVIEKSIEDMYVANEELLKSKNDALEKTDVLEEQNRCLKVENDHLKTQLCDEQKNRQLLENQKSAWEKEKEQLKLQVVKLHCLEVEIDQYKRSKAVLALDEVLDLELKVTALEQSKELAMKEIGCLSKMLKSTVKELDILSDKMQAREKEMATKVTTESNALKEIKFLTSQVQEYQEAVKILATEKYAEVEKMMEELTECKESLKQSQNSETEAKEQISVLERELRDCKSKLEKQCTEDLRIKDSSKEIMEVINKADTEISDLYYLMASWKPGSQSIDNFRSKKCAVLSKCGTIKDNLRTLKEKSQEKLDLSMKNLILVKEKDEKQAQIEALQVQLENEADIRDHLEEIPKLTQECSRLEKENCELIAKLESSEAKLHEKDECCKKLMEEMSSVKQGSHSLQESLRSFIKKTEFFERDVYFKEDHIKQLISEIATKDALIKSLKNEKEEEIQRLMKELTDCQENLKQYQDSEKEDDLSTTKEKELQELVNDHVARLSEAAELYKKQYKEIEKLKKKLTKSKKESQLSSPCPTEPTASNASDVAGSIAGCHDTPINILDNASHPTSPAEVFVLSQNSSDSDTGEHVSEGSAESAKLSKQEKTLKSLQPLGTPPRRNSTDERSALYKALLTKAKKQVTSIEKSSLSNNENPIIRQRVEDRNKAIGDFQAASSKESGSKFCNVNMCPYCGMAFRKYMPKVFLAYHITQHVLECEKRASETQNTAIAESSSNKVTDKSKMACFDGPTPGDAEKLYSVRCPMCNVNVHVSSKTMEALAKHLGKQHDLMMCNCCGILFDKWTPGHFIADHMRTHLSLGHA